MSYALLRHKDADKVLRRMGRPTRQRIAEKIQMLGDNPDDPALGRNHHPFSLDEALDKVQTALKGKP